MDCDGVAVGESVPAHLLGTEVLHAAVVHVGSELAGAGVDGEDHAAFRGHDLAAGAGGEGDDAVAGPVPTPAGGLDLGAGEAARSFPADAGRLVERLHVGPAPGVDGGVALCEGVGGPRVRGVGDGAVSIGRHGDAIL